MAAHQYVIFYEQTYFFSQLVFRICHRLRICLEVMGEAQKEVADMGVAHTHAEAQILRVAKTRLDTPALGVIIDDEAR